MRRFCARKSGTTSVSTKGRSARRHENRKEGKQETSNAKIRRRNPEKLEMGNRKSQIIKREFRNCIFRKVLYAIKLVRFGTHSYKLVHIGTHWYRVVHTGTQRYRLVRFGTQDDPPRLGELLARLVQFGGQLVGGEGTLSADLQQVPAGQGHQGRGLLPAAVDEFLQHRLSRIGWAAGSPNRPSTKAASQESSS